MMKLAEHYGDKPANELPMLFQRILSNCTLDWFRRQKTRSALFSNLSDFESSSTKTAISTCWKLIPRRPDSSRSESAEDTTRRAQILREIETEILELPARQREAFPDALLGGHGRRGDGGGHGLLRGQCQDALFAGKGISSHALSKALKAKGIQL
jgi:RNA polymerase sigma-70 factor (ECF subfamily)